MNYQDQRTKIGRFLFNFIFKSSKFLMKHIWIYYILNYTWGIITTLLGWIVIGFIYIFLKKKIVESGKFGPCHYVIVGNNWGGLELGVNFLVADNMGSSWTQHTKEHESGHTFQNAIFGVFAIFLVYLPSAIRYWYQRLTKGPHKAYDSIWFEGSATTVGNYYYNNYLKEKE